MSRPAGPDLPGWLLFFYSIPSKPVSNRMKVWRKLNKAGALQFKGAVYLLPFQEENREFFQWLVAEIAAMGGQAAYLKTDQIADIPDTEIVALFMAQKEQDYRPIRRSADECGRRLGSISKGAAPRNLKVIGTQVARLARVFEEAKRTDFFSSPAGLALQQQITTMQRLLAELTGRDEQPAQPEIHRRKTADYRNRIWTTRKRPFIDRMASAWLIRKFIDPKAVFSFVEGQAAASADPRTVAFDMTGGEFTHTGDLCTFEVLLRSFGLRDRVVKKIAELVHELDIRDDKYRNPEAAGLEEILAGIRKTARSDQDMLDKGIAVFDMLYASKT